MAFVLASVPDSIRGRTFRDGQARCPPGRMATQAAERKRQGGRAALNASLNDASREIVRNLEDIVGPDRGVFGVAGEDEARRVAELVQRLETRGQTSELAQGRSQDPFPLVYGTWRVIYTSLMILGVKRAKLGLKPRSNGKSAAGSFGVVQLEELMQTVRPDGTATSSVGFNVLLGGIQGNLEIDATFQAEQGTDRRRVLVESEAWSLEPSKAEKLLGEKNINLLLGIFDPTGHLDITYVDEYVRVGRDDKGNVYVLERCHSPPPSLDAEAMPVAADTL